MNGLFRTKDYSISPLNLILINTHQLLLVSITFPPAQIRICNHFHIMVLNNGEILIVMADHDILNINTYLHQIDRGMMATCPF